MSLHIANAQAERLARARAVATGESVTHSMAVAVRERLDRVQHRDGAEVAERTVRIRRIAADAANRWIEPYRSADHGSLPYDESGLPR